jgi:hypothetical protein
MVNTLEQEQDTRPSATVESLKDVDASTCSLDSYKGRTTFAINKNSPYPFSFGILKAKLLVKHALPMIVFVATDGKSIAPPKELQAAWDKFVSVLKSTSF